jgi:hypothetical protein
MDGVRIDDGALKEMLSDPIRRGADLSPLFSDWGEALLVSHLESTGPPRDTRNGKPWIRWRDAQCLRAAPGHSGRCPIASERQQPEPAAHRKKMVG